MTVLTCSPPRDCVNSLGIPVDNLSLQQALDRIVDMARARDGKARLVSTCLLYTSDAADDYLTV